MPDPNNVNTGDLYDRFGNTPNALGAFVTRLRDAVRDPQDTGGWLAILLPAIVTGLAVTLLRRLLL